MLLAQPFCSPFDAPRIRRTACAVVAAGDPDGCSHHVSHGRRAAQAVSKASALDESPPEGPSQRVSGDSALGGCVRVGWHPASSFQLPASGIQHPASSIQPQPPASRQPARMRVRGRGHSPYGPPRVCIPLWMAQAAERLTGRRPYHLALPSRLCPPKPPSAPLPSRPSLREPFTNHQRAENILSTSRRDRAWTQSSAF
jgi:hypothetical protein